MRREYFARGAGEITVVCREYFARGAEEITVLRREYFARGAGEITVVRREYFARRAGEITVLLREFSARQATGSFSLSVQAAGLRGSRQPLNNPGGRQPSLFLRHSLRPDGPSGCAVPGAAVLCAASLPLRPGLRSLLSAPDAGRKPPACQSWFLLKAGVVCSECVQWDSKKFL